MSETVLEIQRNLISRTTRSGKYSISKQKRILNDSIVSKTDLSKILDEYKMTYEDLRYTNYDGASETSERYFTLSDFRERKNNIPLVSFFSGCGGLDLGFEASGFDHSVLIEHNEIFCNTLKFNRPEWNVIGPPNFAGDVARREELYDLLCTEIKLGKEFDGVFAGGPPCQPFSIAANQRFSKSGLNFKRTGFSHETNGNLLFDYIWFIEQFRPRVFLIENVPGLIQIDGGAQLKDGLSRLVKAGYRIEDPFKVNASKFYIPQKRQRLFIIGSLSNRDYDQLLPSKNHINCSEALIEPVSELDNHVTRSHKAESILRYMNLRFGERDKLGRVDRLDPNLPSKTVIAGGSNGGGRSHLHPYIPRTLSVRESARLQTFPDDYCFAGSHARQFTQVGNAVPPVLAAQLASSIKRSFF